MWINLFPTFLNIQGDSGGKVNILGGDRIGHYEKKKVNMNMCLITKMELFEYVDLTTLDFCL
jgi:hypothetical protein